MCGTLRDNVDNLFCNNSTQWSYHPLIIPVWIHSDSDGGKMMLGFFSHSMIPSIWLTDIFLLKSFSFLAPPHFLISLWYKGLFYQCVIIYYHHYSFWSSNCPRFSWPFLFGWRFLPLSAFFRYTLFGTK